MKKLEYETPEIEVIVFETEDVITTSGGNNPLISPDPWELPVIK